MAGFTQVELSEIIGVKHSVISRYEDDNSAHKIEPPLSRVNQIAKACGLPVSFFTDLKHPVERSVLAEEQAARFKNELKSRADIYRHHPGETKACYGNEHPFLYILKERWAPTEYDVNYVCNRHGLDKLLILNTDLPVASDINEKIKETMYRDENGMIIVRSNAESFERIRSFLFNQGFLISDTDAKLFEECGVKVINEDDGSHLYLNIDNIDPEAIRAIIVLTKQAEKYHNEALSRQTKNPPQDQEDPEAE